MRPPRQIRRHPGMAGPRTEHCAIGGSGRCCRPADVSFVRHAGCDHDGRPCVRLVQCHSSGDGGGQPGSAGNHLEDGNVPARTLVAFLVVDRRTNPEIAEALFLTPRTMEPHTSATQRSGLPPTATATSSRATTRPCLSGSTRPTGSWLNDCCHTVARSDCDQSPERESGSRIGPLTSTSSWSGRRDSNPRPSPWQGHCFFLLSRLLPLRCWSER